MGRRHVETGRIQHPARGVLSALLPLSWQRRRITQATEMILSNIGLYASVRAVSVDGGKRLVMELRSPVAIPADVLESTRRYVARKLHPALGLRLRPEQLYLVSLPHEDHPSAPGEPSTGALRRIVNSLPAWASVRRVQPTHDPADSVMAANDSMLPASRLDAAGTRPPPAFEPAEDPRWAAAGVLVQEFSPSEIGTGFAKTEPVDCSAQDLPAFCRAEATIP